MWFVPAAEAADAQTATVPAGGRQQHVFPVGAFGRYAVTVASPQGTSLEVHDRMAGLLGADGVSGERDGRVDLFLDRGDVKAVTLGDLAATGQATVTVTPFSAVGVPRRLERERPLETTLRDLEAKSWWLDLAEAETVELVASGRFLADLRLWADGDWLVDAEPACGGYEARPGEPWTECRLAHALEPGLYLVSAYGGPGRPWTTDRDTAPLDLTWGTPALSSAGQRAFVLPESGRSRFRLPEGVDTVHAALPEVARFEVGGPGWRVGRVTPESRRPVATATGRGGRLVVNGLPGQPYTLTWFQSGGQRVVPRTGDWWVGSVTTQDPADVPPPTGFVAGGQPARRDHTQAYVLDGASFVAERFNLAEAVELAIEVREAGSYVVWVEGPPTDLSLGPWFVDASARPDTARGELHAALEPGLYRLRLAPASPGIATLSAGSDAYAARMARAAGAGPAPTVHRWDLQFPEVTIGGEARSVGLAPARPDSGLVLRELPIDPSDPLPLSLLPSETLEVPITAPGPGTLRVVSVAGDPVPLAVDGQPLTTEVALAAGDHSVRVTNPTAERLRASLSLALLRDDPQRELPELGADRLALLPHHPRLAAGQVVGVDLGPDRPAATAVLGVDRSGLWTVASDGLLATSARLRTRIRTSLVEASGNGPGRNFEIARYLRSGDYQVTVSTEGASAGHARLTLVQAPIVDGGPIRDAVPARVTLPPGQAVRHAITVAESGVYTVRQAGRTRVFDCRLEDAEGWTVTGAPDQPCELTQWLDAGEYVLVGLPDRVETRRATTVAPAAVAEVARSGRGPFPLALGVTGRHTWVEPPTGDRPADVWTLEVPATVTASVHLSDEMAGEIVRLGLPAERLVPGQPWTGVLPAGAVRLELRGARRGTGVPYTVRVEPAALVAGTERTASARQRLPVAIGAPGLYAFESRGDADVRARLYRDGVLVAANDDRPDDWNFRLVTRLEPGDYALQVDAFDGWETTVALQAPAERDGGTVKPGEGRSLTPGPDAVLVGLADRSAEVVVATAVSAENAGVAIEVQDPEGWRTLAVGTGRAATAVARLGDDRAPVRLRVWSEDRRGAPVMLTARGLLERRAGLEGSVNVGKGFQALRTSGGAGQFALGVTEGVWACPDPWPSGDGACFPAGTGLVAGGEDGLVLVRRAGEAQATRVVLGDGAGASIRLGDRPTTVNVAAGLVAAEIHSATGEVSARSSDALGLPAAPSAEPGGALPRSALVVTRSGLVTAVGTPGAGAADARVEVHALDDGGLLAAGEGVTPVELPPWSSWSLALPGARDVVVDLDAGTAVRTGDGRGVWASPAATTAHLAGAAGPLVLVNPTPEPRLARVVVQPLGAGGTLAHGAPHEALHPAAGVLALPVPPDPDGTLAVRGRARATFVAADGRVRAADGAPVGAGGTLLLAVAPGPALAWVAHPGETGPARPAAEGAVARLVSSGAVPLSGDAVKVALSPPRAAVVSLVAPCPLVADVVVPGGWTRTEVVEAGGRVDVAVLDAAQGASVRVRALAGAALYGDLAATFAVPGALSEGVGPEVLLGSGGAAFFALPVTREGRIGLGARAAADRVDVVLLDPAGRRVDAGRLLMPAVTPGTWLLGLSQPPGAPPLRASPVVVGLEVPPEGPPADVIRRYLRPDAPEPDVPEWEEARMEGEGSEGGDEAYEGEGEGSEGGHEGDDGGGE